MYAIVGAGPAGLTLAWLLAKLGKTCVVFDRESQIGGCHRVLRVNGLFTEHSPRVYVSSYLNLRWLLRDMGIPDPFVEYQFGIVFLVSQLFRYLTIREVLYLFLTYFLFLLNPNFGKTTSVADWCCRFERKGIDFIDRLCRFTDGAGADRYSVVKLLQLINQNFFYKLLQLRETSDTGLFSQMREKLEATGKVSFRLSSLVEQVSSGNLVVNGESISFQRILLCIPPKAALPLLGQTLQRVVETSTYDPYLSATFHYNEPLDFSSRWGFPVSEWGLISIPISKYTTGLGSATVFSTTCMFLDRKSSFTGKTLNETLSSEEVLEEIFRQLKETYPELPVPDVKILSPTAYYSSGWRERDSAYIHTISNDSSPMTTSFENVFHIGIHNLESKFAYTTMEAAVTNAIQWYNLYEGGRVVIQNPVPLSRVIRTALVLFFLFRIMKNMRGIL